jgi:hypothetical protein
MNTTQIILATLFSLSFALFAIAVIRFFQARHIMRCGMHDAEKPQRHSPTKGLPPAELLRSTAGSEETSQRFPRRAFFEKLAGTALVTFSGWMAARGANLPWAEELAVGQRESKLKSNSGNSGQVAQNSHGDSHTDYHTDAGHTDNNDHTDMMIGKVHSDIGGHLDFHLDMGHTDNHSDGN